VGVKKFTAISSLNDSKSVLKEGESFLAMLCWITILEAC
jgi:hypothetical protein